MKVFILMGNPRFLGNTDELCKHSDLAYVGLYSVQDEDDLASFRTQEAIDGVKAFARRILA